MARKPSISIRYYTDGFVASPEAESALILKISQQVLEMDQRYWQYISSIDICIVGPERAYLYVAFAAHYNGLKEAPCFAGGPHDSYHSFDDVRFDAVRWCALIDEFLPDAPRYGAQAKTIVDSILFCWHREKFDLEKVVAELNARLSHIPLCGKNKLELTVVPEKQDGPTQR